MSKYTIKDLLASGIAQGDIEKAKEICNIWIDVAKWNVFEFYDAPEEIRKVCCLNGGDEDWLIITEKEPSWFPRWLEKTDSCDDPDEYLLGNAVVYVGSHA